MVPCVLAGAVICVCFSAAASRGQLQAAKTSPVEVQRLIRNMAWNQISDLRHPAHHYEYVQSETKPDGSQDTLEIETSRGSVTRLIAVNGAPPAEKRCRHELAQLARLARSPRQQNSRFRDQQTDLHRREALFEDMPKALLYRFDGIEKGSGWIRLKYEPNASFSPHRPVGGVLKGLAGTLWIDPKTQRLVKIDGQLVKPVTIGWGILAKLYPGGRFIMEQSKLPDGTWRVTMLDVHMGGTVLLIKKLNVDMKDTFGSFKEVADNLTVPEAVKMLDRASVRCSGP